MPIKTEIPEGKKGQHLTPKERIFLITYVKTGSLIKSYRAAYPHSTCSDLSAQQTGCRRYKRILKKIESLPNRSEWDEAGFDFLFVARELMKLMRAKTKRIGKDGEVVVMAENRVRLDALKTAMAAKGMIGSDGQSAVQNIDQSQNLIIIPAAVGDVETWTNQAKKLLKRK